MAAIATGFRSPLPAGYGYYLTQDHNERSQLLYDSDSGFEYHIGEDWANGSATEGPALATANGVVVRAEGNVSGWGNIVVIKHTLPDGSIVSSGYGHLASIYVSVGQDVSIGQEIGLIGNGGFSTGAHLHFNIYLGDLTGINSLGVVHDNPDPDPTNSGYVDPSIFLANHPATQQPDLDARNGDPDFAATLSNSSVVQGNSVTMTYRLSNWGPGNAGGSTTGIYLSTNNVFDASDTLLTTDAVGALAANVGSTETVSISTNNIAVGNYYIFAVANYSHAISETTETNNPSNGVAIQITGPTQAGVAFIVAPQTGTEGSALTFRISIQNPNYASVSDYLIYYSTINGTATAGSDYTGIGNQIAVHFTSSSAQFVDVAVQTLSDSNPNEGSETFNFNLYDNQHSLLRTVQGTILDSQNHAPTVTLPSGANVTASSAGQTFQLSSLFRGSDPDNNPLTYYLYDSNTAANSGRFVVNGTIVPAQTVYQVTASQLAQASFVAGAAGTADDILVQAFDGQAYSGWNAQVHVSVQATNIAPTVSRPSGASVTASSAGQSFGFSSLFAGSDANGDPLTYYLYDSNAAASSGHWVVNGTIVAAQTIYQVAASQLAQTSFVAGAAGTADDILVQAFDGRAYSGWNSSVRVAVPAGPTDDYRDSLTDTSLPFGTVAVNGFRTGALEVVGDRDWFSVQLVGGRTYTISLLGSASGYGTLTDTYLRVHNSAGTQLAQDDDGAGNLQSQLAFTPGTSGTYYLDVGAYNDGLTGTYRVSVSAPSNRAPTVNLPSGASVSATAAQTLQVSSLFSGSDADGDALTYYLYDSSSAANSGRFVVNGTIVPAQTIYQVTASQMAQATFVAGAAGTADDILVQAYDGQAYSGWNAQVRVTVNTAPTISRPAGASVTASTAGQSLAFSSLFAGNDANGDPLTYFLYDSNAAANSGHWVVNGTIVAARTIYQVTASQLAQTSFVVGAAGTADDILAQAFDGKAYSGWSAQVHVSAPAVPNAVPTVSLPSGASVTASNGQSFAFSSLFAGNDADGDPLTYFLYDSSPAANSGHWVVNGTIVPAQTIHQVSAAQLAQTTFVAGASGTSDVIYVQDFDGRAYSGWNAHVNVAVPANAAPTISLPSGTAVQATAAQSLAASGLFSGSDANGDTLTYFVYDSNAAANSGHFAINGATVPARTITQVTAAELAQTTFVAGAAGTTDYLYVEAFDGQVYSPWTEFHVFV